MKCLIKLSILLSVFIFFFTCQQAQARITYYVDAKNGNDKNNGHSPARAWKTLERVNQTSFFPGDSVLFKRGAVWKGALKITSSGSKNANLVVTGFGAGEKPLIQGDGIEIAAVQLYNAQYVEISQLQISNTGKERMANRSGIRVEINGFGTAHGIVLKNLEITDVNGSFVKKEGAGHGILIKNGGKMPSRFDGLLIEGCIIRRSERNGIIFHSDYWNRANWHPNLNVVIRGNLIEEVPGDGIVPIGCDGALIEYNVMRKSPKTLPEGEAAAGMWPWSCDNTILRFNESSDHKALWDAQGFDADYNCTNTMIAYNYSHDNEGGFLLICNDGKQQLPYNIGNAGTKVFYNLSINDGIRPQLARGKIFSPAIHISGPVKNTVLSNNIFYISKKLSPKIDATIINFDSWDGYSDSTVITENIFFVEDTSQFLYGGSTRNFFDNNYYSGIIKNMPMDNNAKKEWNGMELNDCFYLLKDNPYVSGSKIVDQEKIENYFEDIKEE